MNKYRIVSDGIRFRIQKQCKTFWRKRLIWKYCGIDHPDLGFIIRTFNSLEQAEEHLVKQKKEDEAIERGYLPV